MLKFRGAVLLLFNRSDQTAVASRDAQTRQVRRPATPCGAHGQPLSHVARVQPALGVQRLGRHRLVTEVPLEHAVTPDTDLRPGQTGQRRENSRYSLNVAYCLVKAFLAGSISHLSLPVLGVIVHVRYVGQLHHSTGKGSANMAWVGGVAHKDGQ